MCDVGARRASEMGWYLVFQSKCLAATRMFAIAIIQAEYQYRIGWPSWLASTEDVLGDTKAFWSNMNIYGTCFLNFWFLKGDFFLLF